MALTAAAANANWVVFREQTNSIISCKLVSNFAVLVSTSSSGDEQVVIPTFPPLPSDILLCEHAVLNQTGTLLALSTRNALYLITLHSSSPALKQVCCTAQEWILENTTWKLAGKLYNKGTKFTGFLDGPVSGKIELDRDTHGGADWVGTIDGAQGLVRFRFDPRDQTGKFVGQDAHLQRIEDFCAGFSPRDLCFHPLFPRSHLVVLDAQSTVRVYNVLASCTVAENQVKFDKPVQCISFIDGEHEFWQRLALFALCTDGTILAASPIAKPRSTAVRKQDGGKLSKQRQEYLAFAGSDEPAPVVQIQVVDLEPKCPEQRYKRGSAAPAAEAVDFTVTKIKQGGGLMIHRTWSCGKMDVLFAPSLFQVEPLFRKAKLAELWKKEQTGTGGGPFRLLRAKMKTQEESNALVQTSAPIFAENHECIELIRCIEVFSSQQQQHSKPSLLAVRSHALAFVCLNELTGEPVLFKATWAAHNNTTTMNGGVPQVDATRLALLPNRCKRHTCAVYADPNIGVGLAMAGGIQIDLTSRLRLLGTTVRISPLLQGDGESATSVSDSHDFAQYRKDLENANALFEHMQQSLNAFPQTPIPLDFSGQELNSLDEDTAFAAATWLSDNFNWSANAEQSLVARLMDSHSKLVQAAQHQQEVYVAIQDEVLQWKQTFEFMEDERHSLELDIIELKTILVKMKLAARNCLKRAQALRTASSEERAFTAKLAQTRQDCQQLDVQVHHALEQAQTRASAAGPLVLLNEPEQSEAAVEEVDEVERIEWIWRSALNCADEARVLAHNLPPTHMRVFLISTAILAESEVSQALSESRPIQVYIADKLLAPALQQLWRKQMRLMHLPMATEDGVRVVLIKDEEVYVRTGDLNLELSLEFRLANDPLVGKYLQVDPQGFNDEPETSVFGHVLRADDTTLRHTVVPKLSRQAFLLSSCTRV